ncbi:Z1 domain-containing protein [Limosilactobacillus mucosae]|uniref:Z1 domain-containing protein n=1 Tax=Limosilactobacillus mucosae TaxID=97478 RepID=A0AAJ1HM46_LIMMU|nr:Z1 domain-containing protein [Limosilactobacillus mucosae]MDC2826913.1 Z1 domain-containing protein [Limosilactobacillus mucosae]MDC2834612.1 Z1 domain-containing protein [Limosilactobacillus mucosae]
MSYLNDYVSQITHEGNPQFAASIQKTAEEAYQKISNSFDYMGGRKTGLLFGNIQSGKTGHMFGIICAAADDIFPLFILLTTDNVTLHKQTLERVQKDLPDFCICGEYDTEKFNQNNLIKPTIVVLKKNFHTLHQWANNLKSSGVLAGNPLFILDDEADASSLNTLVNNNKQSTINKYLDEINQLAIGSIYLQSTATPQALLLQTADSTWHPDFAVYFTPGQQYLGGNFFFPENKIPSCINYIDEEANPLEEAVLHHLVVATQMLNNGDKVCNMMIHPSVRVAKHQEYANKAQRILNSYKEDSDSFKAKFSKMYDNVAKEADLMPQNKLFRLATNLLDSTKIYMLNGKEHVQAEDYATGSNIVIGGNTLGRGVTFPKLQTIYYVRSSKRPQADTMWQHSRMFGYDRHANMMAVYISKELYKLFKDINSVNNAIVQQIDSSDGDLSQMTISLPEGLSPTRANVLDSRYVHILFGGKNYFPFNPINKSFDAITKVADALDPIDNHQPSKQVNLAFFIRILENIDGGNDFNVDDYITALQDMIKDHHSQGVLIVRRNRDITQGTGALLSPNDLALGMQTTNMPVLTLYEVVGKGWHSSKIWVPNIKFPVNKAIYHVTEKKDENEDD